MRTMCRRKEEKMELVQKKICLGGGGKEEKVDEGF